MLTIIWHLLADPNARYYDLGSDWHESKINKQTAATRPCPPTRTPHRPQSRPRTPTRATHRRLSNRRSDN